MRRALVVTIATGLQLAASGAGAQPAAAPAAACADGVIREVRDRYPDAQHVQSLASASSASGVSTIVTGSGRYDDPANGPTAFTYRCDIDSRSGLVYAVAVNVGTTAAPAAPGASSAAPAAAVDVPVAEGPRFARRQMPSACRRLAAERLGAPPRSLRLKRPVRSDAGTAIDGATGRKADSKAFQCRFDVAGHLVDVAQSPGPDDPR